MNQPTYEQRKAHAFFKEAGTHGNNSAYDAALISIERALKFFPTNPQYLYTKAMVLEGLKRYPEAEPIWRDIAAQLPDQAASWFYLGRVCNNVGKRDEAIECYRKALGINPTALEVLVNLADEIMNHKKEHDLEKLERGLIEAIDLLRRAVTHYPESMEALNGLALALQRLGKASEALPYFERAHQLSPHNTDVLVNLAIAYTQLERFDEAEKVFTSEVAQSDWYSEFLYSQLLLLKGDFARGVKMFETRNLDPSLVPREFPYPQWNGEDLTGKTLYVWADQGIGDEIMHASLLNDVILQAQKVYLETESRLIPAYTRSFHSIEIIRRRSAESDPPLPIYPADYHISNISLMGFAKSRMDYPVHQGYLLPDEDKVKLYAERYAPLSNKLKIGISWRSQKTETSRMRTIGLKEWLPIFQVPNTVFFNLQYGDCNRDLTMLEKECGIQIISDADVDPLTDLENMFGLMANLDLVISCANSTVHIAGAIGTPCWVLTPKIPSWRWQLKRDDNIWYPHVRLFRQSDLCRWDDVVQSIKGDMENLAIKKPD